MATSLQTIAVDVATFLEGGEFLSGTASSGSTTTLVDSSGDSPFNPADDTSRFKRGATLYIHADSGQATNVGEERFIKTYTPSSQTITMDSAQAFPAALSSTSQYYALRVLSWARIKDCINDVLRRLYYRTTSPLTLVTDGDMETSGTSNYTGSSATLAKNTTAANIFRGTQALSIATTGANGYAETASIPVNENESYFIEVMARATASTSILDLIVRDQTNSADVTLSGEDGWTATDGQDWVRLYGTFQVPANCQNIRIRLRDQTSGNTSYWDDLILVHQSRSRLPSPSWVLDGILENVYWLDGGSGYQNPRSRRRYPVTWFASDEDPTAVTTNWIRFEGAGSHALIAEGLARYSTLSADSSTTNADRDLVVAGALAEAYRRLAMTGGDARGAYLEKQREWEAQFHSLLAAFQPRPRLRLQLSGHY